MLCDSKCINTLIKHETKRFFCFLTIKSMHEKIFNDIICFFPPYLMRIPNAGTLGKIKINSIL